MTQRKRYQLGNPTCCPIGPHLGHDGDECRGNHAVDLDTGDKGIICGTCGMFWPADMPIGLRKMIAVLIAHGFGARSSEGSEPLVTILRGSEIKKPAPADDGATSTGATKPALGQQVLHISASAASMLSGYAPGPGSLALDAAQPSSPPAAPSGRVYGSLDISEAAAAGLSGYVHSQQPFGQQVALSISDYAGACLSGHDPATSDLVRMQFKGVPGLTVELWYFQSQVKSVENPSTDYGHRIDADTEAPRIPPQVLKALDGLQTIGVRVAAVNLGGTLRHIALACGQPVGSMGAVIGARLQIVWSTKE